MPVFKVRFMRRKTNLSLDLRKESAAISRFIAKRVDRFDSTTNVGPGEGAKVSAVELGFDFEQGGWVALIFDTRQKPDRDGEWNGFLEEETMLQRPEWAELSEALREGKRVAITLMNGRKTSLTHDCEALGEVLYHMLKDTFTDSIHEGAFRSLPRRSKCYVGVEETEGRFGWPDYDDRDSEGTVQVIETDAVPRTSPTFSLIPMRFRRLWQTAEFSLQWNEIAVTLLILVGPILLFALLIRIGVIDVRPPRNRQPPPAPVQPVPAQQAPVQEAPVQQVPAAPAQQFPPAVDPRTGPAGLPFNNPPLPFNNPPLPFNNPPLNPMDRGDVPRPPMPPIQQMQKKTAEKFDQMMKDRNRQLQPVPKKQ